MQYDIGFNDKSACNKISEITFYCFYLLSTNFPLFFFFFQICARKVIFDVSSRQTVVVFHLSLTR